MKNIITLLFILFGVTIYAQDLSIRIDAAKYRHVTTAVRDTYVVPAGQTWRIFNTTTGTWQSNNAGAGWVNDAGAGGGIGSLLEDTSPQLGGNLETNGSNITVNGDQINNALLISSESVQINGDGVGAGLTGWQIDSEGSTFNSSARINFKNELSGGGYQSEYSLAWGGVPTQSADLVPLGYAQANFAPITAGVTDGDKGDITVSGSGAVWDIDVDAVDATHIQTDAVGINEIANNSVNTGEIVDGAVSSTDIADGTILEQDLSTTNGQVSGWILTSNGTTQFTWADPNVLAGTTSWGLITGTLSSQTDLQTALDDRITKTANTIGISDFSITATGTPPNGIFIDGQNGTTELTGGTTAANEVEQMLFGDLWTVDFKVNGAGVDYSLNSTGTPTNGTDLITKTYADTNYGGVNVSGTPVAEQLAIWTNANTIEGQSGLIYDGLALDVVGNITASSNIQGASLSIEGATSGTATITAPAVAGTPTLTLPTTTGTLALTSDDTLGSDGDKGDITVGGSGTTLTIDDDAVDSQAIATGAVTASEIDTGAVGSGEILDGQILEADLNISNAGTDNYLLSYNAAGVNFTWIDPAGLGGGGGDVTKVGTPIDNQVGVWTGDGTLEGDADLTFNGTVLDVTGGFTIGSGTSTATFAGNDLIFDRTDGSSYITQQGNNNLIIRTRNLANTADVNRMSFRSGADSGDASIYSYEQLFINRGNGSNQSATLSQDMADYDISVNAASTISNYKGIIGVGESTSTVAAGIASYDDGISAALGLSFFTGNNSAVAEALKIDSSGDITASGTIGLLGSTSGTATITAPAVAGTPTLTLPTTTGTLALTSDIIDPSGTYLPLAGGSLSGDLTMSNNNINNAGTVGMAYLRVVPTDTEPAAAEGNVYFDDSENTLKQHNGTGWEALNGSGTYLPLAGGTLSGGLDITAGGLDLNSTNITNTGNISGAGLISNSANTLRIGINENQVRIDDNNGEPYYHVMADYGSIIQSYDGLNTWLIGNREGYVSTQKDSTRIGIFPVSGGDYSFEFDYEDNRWEIRGDAIQLGEKAYGRQYVKDDVFKATTGNITLSGSQTIDGLSVSDGEIILVKDQTDQTENGLYKVSTSGAWVRSTEMDVSWEFSGSIVYVITGTTNEGTYWQCTNSGTVNVGVTNITFTEATWVGGTTNWGTPVDTNILPDTDQTHNIGAVGNVFQDIYANAFNGSLFGSNVEVNTVSAGQYYVIYPQTSDLDPIGFSSGRVLLFNNSTEDRVKLGIGGTSTVESVAYLSDITDTYLPSENTFVKETVKNATTGNITLSGNQTIDGNLTSNGDRILVRAQTDPIENGIYVADAGAWSRAEDMNANFEVSGSLIYVQFGNTLFNKYYFCTNTGSVGLGSVAVTFAETDLQGGGGGGSIGGSITDNQIAIGATTANDIEGSADLTFDATTGTLGVNANRTGGINKVLDLLIPDMIANDWAQITLGESQTSGDAGEFSFVKGATAPANYFTLGLYNNQFLEMWNDDTFHLLAGETVLEDLNPDLSGYDGMSYTTDLTNPLAFTWSVNNSTAGSPTVIGTVDYNNGTEGTQFRLGDLGNTLENQYNAGTVLKSWATLVLDAGTESLVQTDFTDADYNDDVTEGLRVNLLEDKQVTIRQSNVAARTAPYLEVQEESGAVVMSLDESGILNLDKAGADALVNDNVVTGAAYYTGAPQGTVGTRWRMYGTSGGNLSFDTGSSNADYTLATNTNRYTLNETGIPAIATDLIDKAYADANYTAGSGDVTKVGTPVDNQIGVWTGDGTLEGGSNFTLNGDNLLLTDTTPEFSVLSTGVSAAIYRLGNSTGNWHFEAATDIFRFAETGVGYAFTINEGNGSNIDFSRALSVNGDITLLANKDLILTGATSGTSTIQAPAIAGTATLTLPASTGTLATNMIVETVSSSITLDGFRGADDQTADTASFTVDGAVAGGTYQVIINRATAPTITGATQLPNTQAFIAATKMALTFIVNADSSVSYTYTEL